MAYRIAMLGAGSGFTNAIADGLCRAKEIFGGSTLVLMDINEDALNKSLERQRAAVKKMADNR